MELTVRGLRVSFGQQAALRQIDLDLQGEVVALLGPNGSGKTTLLRCLATALRPDQGVISFCGQPYSGDLRQLRGQIGYLPQELDLPGYLTPFKLLAYLAQLKKGFDPRQVPSLIEYLGLNGLAHRPFSELSGGQTRLVGTAQAFLGTPRLLLLDELTRGLDLEEREKVFRLLYRSGRPRLAFFSTHLPADAEYAHQVVILHSGEVLFSGSPSELLGRVRERVWEIRLPAAEAAALPSQYCTSRVQPQGELSRLRMIGTRPPHLLGSKVEPTLEDAYIWITRSALDRQSGITR